jgi:tetratricopeptide (TPR) repeat protein
MKKVVLLVVAVCFTVLTFAQDAGALVEQANAAVESKDYAKAIELYEKVLATPDHGQNVENISKAVDQLKLVVAKGNAKEAFATKDYTKAVEVYNGLIESKPGDAAVLELAGKGFYNEGAKNYKSKSYLDAVKCFTVAEKEFKYEKATKLKNASIKKLAGELASEGKISVDDVDVCDENKELLKKGLAKAYVTEGNGFYKNATAVLIAANEKVSAGSITTADDAYVKEVGKVKTELKKAIQMLEKAKGLDTTNKNAQVLLEACTNQLSALK